jgi:hypothetical protein
MGCTDSSSVFSLVEAIPNLVPQCPVQTDLLVICVPSEHQMEQCKFCLCQRIYIYYYMKSIELRKHTVSKKIISVLAIPRPATYTEC